jgi:hypothetical protein
VGAIAGANKEMPAMMGTSRSFSSHDKYNNQLQVGLVCTVVDLAPQSVT